MTTWLYSVVLLIVSLVIGTVPAAAQAKRVALVVGNSAYAHAIRLGNPINDARDISAALWRLGFEVSTATDLSSDTFHDAISTFSKSAETADLALFFYAGHAVQFDGVNYLLPIDIKVDNAYDLERKAVLAHKVVGVMQRAKTSIMLLDACRNNTILRSLEQSLPEKSRSAAQSRGLARIDLREGDTLLGFATAPGEVAADGTGRNSPYTVALLNHIERQGIDLLELLTSVGADVRAATRQQQRPEFLSKLITTVRLAAHAASDASAAPVVPAAPQAHISRERDASVAWDTVSKSCDRGLVESFRARYADTFVGSVLAARRLGEIAAGGACPAGAAAAIAVPPSPSPANEQVILVRSVQRELTRVGCDAGEIDGVWGGKTRVAAEEFKRLTKATFSVDSPTMDLLEAVKRRTARVCPIVCAGGEIEKDGKCVARTAAPPLARPARTTDQSTPLLQSHVASRCDVYAACAKNAPAVTTTPHFKMVELLQKCGPKPQGC